MSNAIKLKLMKALKEKSKNRKQLVKELKIPRTTIFDNLKTLEKLGKIKCFNVNYNNQGRPFTYWKILNEHNINESNDISKLDKINNKKIIMSIKFRKNSVNLSRKNISSKFTSNVRNYKKTVVFNDKKTIIKKKISINKCFKCHREINQNLDLIKLKDGNYYCYDCISRNKKTFDLLSINGYWYNYFMRYKKCQNG